MNHYTVQVRIEVEADTSEGAEDAVVGIIRQGLPGRGARIAPVMDLKVEEGAPKLLDKLPSS